MDFREIGAPGCSGASILLTGLHSRVGNLPSSGPPPWCFGTASSTELCRASGQDAVQLEGSGPKTSQGTLGSLIPTYHKVSAMLEGQLVQRYLAVDPCFAGFPLLWGSFLFSALRHVLAKYPFGGGGVGNIHPFLEEKSLPFVPHARDDSLRGASAA